MIFLSPINEHGSEELPTKILKFKKSEIDHLVGQLH
jgi:hypothetical protein